MSIEAKLFTPEHPEFEERVFSRVFNIRRPADRRPVAILVAETEQDVADGVKWAKERGHSVTVRSGGHSWAVWSVQNGTLLIDLGKLNQASFDEATGVASAGPATKGGEELDPFLAERGRFLNGGHCPPVGIGGFLLQGGQGWNQRGWGWAAEHIVAIDVVTAEGEIVRADATQNQDLYWAARGAGPSFPGIVVKFHLKTQPRFKFLGHSVQMYELADFDEAFTWLQGMEPSLADTVEIVAVSMMSPPGLLEQPRRVFAITAAAFADNREEAEAVLAPFQNCPIIDRAIINEPCADTQLADHRAEQLRMNPEDHRWYCDNIWAEGKHTEVTDRLKKLFVDIPSEKAFTIWMGNGLMRPLPDMAFSLQAPGYVSCYFVYENEADDVRYRNWLNEAMTEAQPVTVGQYLGDSDMTNRQLKFMADENYAKLQQIIADRDPDGVFVRYLAKDPATVNKNHWEL